MQNLELEYVNFTFGNDIEMIFHSDGFGSKYDWFEFLLACKGLHLINTAYLFVFDVPSLHFTTFRSAQYIHPPCLFFTVHFQNFDKKKHVLLRGIL